MQLARLVSADGKTRKPDLLTVELAALLHDVLDKKYVSPAEAADPYAFFLPFFTKWASESGVDLVQDGRARDIAKIVTNVSWSTEKKLREAGLITDWHRECIELHCVQDADRLDAIGAFGRDLASCIPRAIDSENYLFAGILRCAAYSAAVNRYVEPLFCEAGAHESLCRPLHAGPDDPARENTAVQHFYDKLLHIREQLKTAPGKTMAEKRHKLVSRAMYCFLSRLLTSIPDVRLFVGCG